MIKREPRRERPCSECGEISMYLSDGVCPDNPGCVEQEEERCPCCGEFLEDCWCDDEEVEEKRCAGCDELEDDCCCCDKCGYAEWDCTCDDEEWR